MARKQKRKISVDPKKKLHPHRDISTWPLGAGHCPELLLREYMEKEVCLVS